MTRSGNNSPGQAIYSTSIQALEGWWNLRLQDNLLSLLEWQNL